MAGLMKEIYWSARAIYLLRLSMSMAALSRLPGRSSALLAIENPDEPDEEEDEEAVVAAALAVVKALVNAVVVVA